MSIEVYQLDQSKKSKITNFYKDYCKKPVEDFVDMVKRKYL